MDLDSLLSFYIIGCVFAIVLTGVRLVLRFTLKRLTNLHILEKNLAKIGLYYSPTNELVTDPPNNLLIWLGIALEMLLSWIEVLLCSWQILAVIIDALKTCFDKPPLLVRDLRYSLRNYPDLASEAVWARFSALLILCSGVPPSAEGIHSSLVEFSNKVKSFSAPLALQCLKDLKVVRDDIIADVEAKLKTHPAGGV